MSSLPWPPESDATEAERWASESQWDVPPGVWVREATPEEVDLLRDALDDHRRALDMEAERALEGRREPAPLAADLVLFLLLTEALVLGPVALLIGFLIRMAVE